MDLILWRHAEAEEGSNDLARELTRKGQQQAGLMAAWLRLRLPRDFQLLASERAKRSIVPLAFWYFSLVGGIVLLCYALHKRDPVFIVGQATGVFVYLRNLYLIRSGRQQAEA